MAHAYTPGLKVSERMIYEKVRSLPLKGDVLVRVGERVRAETIVARTQLPGKVQLVNVVNKLGILPSDIHDFMLKKEGEPVSNGEPIAQTAGFFGLFRSVARSPVDGFVESISTVTGQVLIREHPIPVQVNAFVDGEVVAVSEGESATVRTCASFVQGIFGIGGERTGRLKVLADSPDSVLDAGLVTEDCRGCILLGGSLVKSEAFKKAAEVGASGIIAGGINDWDLREILGYDIGVAITGSEEIALTVVVTEGFGRIRMADRTFGLLKSREGMKTSITGATQIRAGVMRPEVVIPLDAEHGLSSDSKAGTGQLNIGTLIRVIRQPYFGRLGKVTALPVPLKKLETESHVRVLEVELDDGTKVVLPRANIEIIED